jgi:hypothetical protein
MFRAHLLLLLATLALRADESGVILEGQLARSRKGIDLSYVNVSTRDTWDISWDASLGVVDPGQGRSREFRAAAGLGGYGHEAMGFVELIAAGGGPWGVGVGLRMRGGWYLAPRLHLGVYAVTLAGKTTRSEAGITCGFHFPH